MYYIILEEACFISFIDELGLQGHTGQMTSFTLHDMGNFHITWTLSRGIAPNLTHLITIPITKIKIILVFTVSGGKWVLVLVFL